MIWKGKLDVELHISEETHINVLKIV